jgi:hypothetical protein
MSLLCLNFFIVLFFSVVFLFYWLEELKTLTLKLKIPYIFKIKNGYL